MPDIFVYGTLMFDPVWYCLVRRRYPSVAATLDGFRCLAVTGEPYPAIIPQKGSSVNGKLINGVSDADMKILDRFEGSYYQRQSVSVTTEDGLAETAQAYVLRPRYRHILSRQDWQPEYFADKHLKQFVSRLSGY